MNKESERGFTLIELLVVVSIVALIFSIVMVNYRSAEKQFALQRSAHKLTQDIRRVQAMAMVTKETGGAIPDGYGIYFSQASPEQYILFADFEGDGAYQANSFLS